MSELNQWYVSKQQLPKEEEHVLAISDSGAETRVYLCKSNPPLTNPENPVNFTLYYPFWRKLTKEEESTLESIKESIGFLRAANVYINLEDKGQSLKHTNIAIALLERIIE